MDWEFVLGLGAVTIGVIGLVIYFGLKLSRAVQQHASESDFAQEVTPAGVVLTACMVAIWVLCAVARELAPGSSLGAFVSQTDGVIAVMAASIIFYAIAAVVLQKLGYPIAK